MSELEIGVGTDENGDTSPDNFPLIAEGWQNPSADNPILLQKILRELDLAQIKGTLDSLYCQEEDYRFRFPPEAVLKTMIYFKLKGYKFLTDAWRDIMTVPELADDLGYSELPDYNTLYHFLTKRMNSHGTKKVFDALVMAVVEEGKRYGLEIGREVGQDATPIPAKKKDEDADWNGHYEIWCYLWHNLRDMETGIPLDYHITNGREDESHLLAPMLMRLIRIKKIAPIRLFIDCGYTGFENMARLSVYWNIDIVCNIANDWIFHDDATRYDIGRWYQKLWKEPYFKEGASFYYKLYALMLTDEYRFKLVGAFFRNDILAKYEEAPDGYMDFYHLRNRVESGHGNEKRQTEITHIEAKGIERVTTHIGMHLISILAIALYRLQHGVSTGLTNLAGLQ